MALTVGMLLFPSVTQLDLTGPYEVFSRMPDAKVVLMAPHADWVRSEFGLRIMPDCTLENAPHLDILFIPGGSGTSAIIKETTILRALRDRAETARYVTSVCTGALVLGAAGLLRGYRATTHWLSLDLLPLVGAIPCSERIVIDRNRITAGGVTAGIDFGLSIAAEIYGRKVAEQIQLMLEYCPQPPFDSGSPATASPDLVENIRRERSAFQEERKLLLRQLPALS
ncbi:MAG TPA: DJ-1/PfpI family protein [Tepidisphaeraceae bacterium]|jgi:cyclohexyl-isocyanide hydratase|nr:DJ-1/PfpI family protein [Tepidisphaeraceae bacterium]